MHELLLEPAAGPVHVARAHHHAVKLRLAHQALALLLRAPVRRLHRQRLVLAQDATIGLARDDGRDEHEALHARRLRRLEQPPSAFHVHLVDLVLVTLRGDLGGQVHDAVGLVLRERIGQVDGRGQVADHGSRAFRFGAGPAHQRQHFVAVGRQLPAGRMTDEPARSRYEDTHGANDTLARWTCR